MTAPLNIAVFSSQIFFLLLFSFNKCFPLRLLELIFWL